MDGLLHGGLVERERLLDRFRTLGRDARVVGVWAAPGSGKSTLLRQWLARTPGECILVDRPRDAAIEAAHERLRSADRAHPPVLLIDDVHEASPRALRLILELIEAEAASAGVVLSGRYDPFPASPLRWALTHEIRGDDLAFTEDEAAAFFTSRDVDLTGAEIAQVIVRTQGWPTAFVLVAHALRDAKRSGADIVSGLAGNRAIADFLVSEVIDSLSPEERDVLLWSAVADDVPLTLAAIVSGHTDAGAILDALARRNALIAPAPDGESYRIHPVLFAYLRAERRRRDAASAARGHATAARWFAQRGELAAALDQAVESSDGALVSDILSVHSYELIFRGHVSAVLRAVQRFPAAASAEHLESRLRLLLDAPHFTDRVGGASRIASSAALARPSASESADAVDAAVRMLWEHAGTTGATPSAQTGNVPHVAEDQTGAALFVELARTWSTAGSNETDRRNAASRLTSIGAAAGAEGLGWLRMLALESAFSLRAMAGDWTEAQPLLLSLLTSRDLSANPADGVASRIAFAHASLAYHRAEPLPLGMLRSMAGSSPIPGAYDHQQRAELLLALDRLDREPGRESLQLVTGVLDSSFGSEPANLGFGVIPWMCAALESEDVPLTERIFRRAARVLGEESLETRLLALMMHPERENEIALRTLLESAEPGREPFTVVYCWTILAVVAEQRHRSAHATEDILMAVKSAAALRPVRPLLLAAGAGAALLRSRVAGFGPWRDVAEDLLMHVDVIRPDADELQALLTRRERELLRELPAHQTTNEIAAKYQVSANTVKTQLKSIYRKLRVGGRTEAVAVAKEHGLL
ncbi:MULTISPECIES: LuxR C-terminal-related transcriptional regulator [unclassified Microbacterium]|uniref:LuxR C-terminal-related transcriptional regulator n=1 Tax=unclassified Microbacterium TaxID=2609290 RepID=UPI0012FAE626|nr:LuxR C-terminal-related transcriptional regulator [Microbacterium sp. MAH-37]